MTREQVNLSRRKVLGAIGTIGIASAGAGLGTTAYFSDEETYTNNYLEAGSLDLKIDWEEHYSDWSADEEEGLEFDVLMDDPMDSMYVGLPNPNDPLIWVHMDDLDQFMDNTAIDAYPDADGDGSQDQDEAGNPIFLDENEERISICETDSDLDAALSSPLRTVNQDTATLVDGEVESYKSLVALDDVKPGDFGELTLSFHLCDNPGYVWLRGECQAFENGYTEPELADDDESGEPGDDPANDTDVELLDAVQVIAWYDEDGDNVLDGAAGQDICAQLVLDSSGSMTADDGDGVSRNEEMKDGAKQLVDALLDANPDNRVGVTEFDSDSNLLISVNNAASQDQTQIDAAIDGIDAQGGTDIAEAINTADSDLAECPDGTRTIMIVVTDGQNNDGSGPVQTASDDANNTDEIFAIGTGGATQASLEAIADPDDDAHIELTSDLTNAIANLTAAVLGEVTFFEGTLRDFCDALSTTPDGFNVPGIPLDGNRATGERDCFNASDTNHIGVAWWLPVDHANEIQTDRVEFDLGFYTEQCRHNDGAGQTPEEPDTQPA